MRIDYDELRRIYRAEKNSSALVEVDDDFFDSLTEFFERQREEYLRSLRDISGSKAKSFTNLRKIIGEIFSLREKKLLNKALIAVRTGDFSEEKMSGPEKETMQELLRVLGRHQRILDEILSMPEEGKDKKAKEKFAVKLLQDVPAFIGADMKEYGPFPKGQEAELPEKIASLLVARKLAESPGS
ncbi:MAG: hypothetical protein NTW59_02635 [Candidatus Diapherotrites archaeon]|nr:hypothetical protein [Candidatus Diapherotrites archaeon]